MFNILAKINIKVIKTVEIIIYVLFLSMTLLVILDVFCRFILNSPLTWGEELARYLLIWVSCLGAGIIFGEHIRVEFLLNILPYSTKKILIIIGDILAILFLVFLLTEGIPRALILRGTETPALPGITMFWVYLAFPCLGFIGTLIGLKKLTDNLSKEK